MGARQDDIDAVLADPPQVHWGAPRGVWNTDRSCYEFIASALPEDGSAATLETGCGISTVLLAQWAARHVAVVPKPAEVDACRAYLEARGLAEAVSFEVGWSDEVLPRLSGPPLDLVLVDGGHGFPAPILDWYYAAARLKEGGVVVLDDLQLPQVKLGLLEFLDADPRWERAESTDKWAAYRRLSAGPLREEWRDQAFLDG
jgi:predicted O-methyltransferase YrrM